MVIGLEAFREAFKGYEDCYTIIGGTACDILMNKANLDFRATRDIDMILLIENRFEEFGEVLWKFIKDGVYRCGWKSSEKLHFYRFTEPQNPNMVIEELAPEVVDMTFAEPVEYDSLEEAYNALFLEDWKKAYIDAVNNNKVSMVYSFGLCDINNDGIPEILTNDQTSAGEGLIYLNKNNEVKQISGGLFSYGDKCVTAGYAKMGVGWDNVYVYNDTSGDYDLKFKGTYNSDFMSDYKVNEKSCTLEEYKSIIDSYTEGTTYKENISNMEFKWKELVSEIIKY